MSIFGPYAPRLQAALMSILNGSLKASALYFSPGSYINWDLPLGITGYGIRDNNGTLEFKDDGGSWLPFEPSGGSGWHVTTPITTPVISPTDPTCEVDIPTGPLRVRCMTEASSLNGHRAPIQQIVAVPVKAPGQGYPITTNCAVASNLWLGVYDNPGFPASYNAGPGPYDVVSVYQYMASPKVAAQNDNSYDYSLWAWNSTIERFPLHRGGVFGFELDLVNQGAWDGLDPSVTAPAVATYPMNSSGTLPFYGTTRQGHITGFASVLSDGYTHYDGSAGFLASVAGSDYVHPAVDILSVADGGTGTITVTTDTVHDLGVGDYVVISGTTDYDGIFVVIVAATTKTFKVTANYTYSKTGFSQKYNNARWRYGFVASACRDYAFYSGGRENNVSGHDTNTNIDVDPVAVLYNDTDATSLISTSGTHTYLLKSPDVNLSPFNLAINTPIEPACMVLTKGATTGGTEFGFVHRDSTDTSAFYVSSDGAGYLKAASWTYGSDRNLKERISALDRPGLSTILRLRPSKFDYINGSKNQYGFIAQEVQVVLPEAVSVNADGTLALSMNFFIPFTVAAIQELSQQVEALKAELASLKGGRS